MKTIVTAIVFALCCIPLSVQSRVIFENDKVICFDTSGCKKKSTLEDAEAVAKVTGSQAERDLKTVTDAMKDPEAFKRLLQGQTEPEGASSMQQPQHQGGAVPAFKAGSFPLSEKGVDGTVRALTGIDTDEARAVGYVARGDAEVYCSRETGVMAEEIENGTKTKTQCINEILSQEKGKTYSVSANCDTGLIFDSASNKHKLVKIEYDAAKRQFGFWLDALNERVSAQDGSDAPTLLDRRFNLLCPNNWNNNPRLSVQSMHTARLMASSNKVDVVMERITGRWGQTREECKDEEGPNWRMTIHTDPKTGPLMSGYEIECQIKKISGYKPMELQLICKNEEGASHNASMTVDSHGPESLGYKGRAFYRCKE